MFTCLLGEAPPGLAVMAKPVRVLFHFGVGGGWARGPESPSPVLLDRCLCARCPRPSRRSLKHTQCLSSGLPGASPVAPGAVVRGLCKAPCGAFSACCSTCLTGFPPVFGFLMRLFPAVCVPAQCHRWS